MDGHALWFNKLSNNFHEDDVLQTFTNTFVVVYLDDILIYIKTWKEHLQHIQ